MKLINCQLRQTSLALMVAVLLGSSCRRMPENLDQVGSAREIAHNLARNHFSPEKFYASITEVRLLDKTLFRDRLADCHVYAVTGMDAWSNPLFVNRPLVICPKAEPKLLFDSISVAKYLSRLNIPVDTSDEARRRLDLFVDLQSYVIEELHALGNYRANDDVETGHSWSYRCVFITDVNILRYEEYVIAISPSGELVVEEKTFLRQRTGYM